MTRTQEVIPRTRNRRRPKPVAKRGHEDKKYHTRDERQMFQLGNRAALKEGV